MARRNLPFFEGLFREGGGGLASGTAATRLAAFYFCYSLSRVARRSITSVVSAAIYIHTHGRKETLLGSKHSVSAGNPSTAARLPWGLHPASLLAIYIRPQGYPVSWALPPLHLYLPPSAKVRTGSEGERGPDGRERLLLARRPSSTKPSDVWYNNSENLLHQKGQAFGE